MSDLYIRPYETPHVRRRILFSVTGIVVAAIVIGLLVRRGCSGADPELADEPVPVEEDPRIEKLLGAQSNAQKPEDMEQATPQEPEPEAPVRETAPKTGAKKVKPAPKQRDSGAADAATVRQPAGDNSEVRLLAAAMKHRETGNLLKAKDVALRTLDLSKSEETLQRARKLLGEINIELITTPHVMPEKADYTVKSGDTLAALAKEHGTTVGLIQRGNNIAGAMIRIGDRLRIFSGSFSMRIDKSTNILDLYLNENFFKRYRVGTGEYNRTPVGKFTITDRIPEPTWWKPNGKAVPFGDPENQLGTHWLSISIRGYGIHGTWEPETIGKQASAGCVRLLNENIEELYTILPIGTEVVIQD